MHDFIQWLFPLDTPSPVNPAAPTLTSADCVAFARDEQMRANLLRAFERMLRFYGFASNQRANELRINRSHNWPERSREWLWPGNHNYLRITRILRSLNLLGRPEESRAFYAALLDAARELNPSVIGQTTLAFWKDAATIDSHTP